MLPIVPEAARHDGNEQVVKMLEDWVIKAKQGKINHIALVACEGSGKVSYGNCGAIGTEFSMNWGLDSLKERLFKVFHSRSAPTDASAPANRFCFNMMQMAPSFDFMNWLAVAEMERIREGAPGPLRVGFWKGTVEASWKEEDRRPGMFEKVCRPALDFIGAVEDESAVNGRTLDCYLLRAVTEAAKRGETVPTFKATEKARMGVGLLLQGKRPVVITLREAIHWPHRNSNLDEWLKFARYLQRAGETVIFVRDTAKADFPISNYEFEIFPEASKNLDIRLALYEASKCSLFAANGPWNLAVFAEFPWLMLNEALVDDPFDFNTPEGWMKHNGIAVGEQLLWSRPDQRIIWKPDTYANMREAWDELMPLLQERVAA